MEILQFIFSSFWHFIGTLIIISIVLGGLSEIIAAFNKPKIKEVSTEILPETVLSRQEIAMALTYYSNNKIGVKLLRDSATNKVPPQTDEDKLYPDKWSAANWNWFLSYYG